VNAYICDNCKRQEPPTPYGSIPNRWYTVTGGSPYETRHFCSPACLVLGVEVPAPLTEQPSPEVVHD
jgi:hypothetical protein